MSIPDEAESTSNEETLSSTLSFKSVVTSDKSAVSVSVPAESS